MRTRQKYLRGCLALACLGACAPLPITYYQPIAEGARVVQLRCDQAPPYAAELKSGDLTTKVSFERGEVFLSLVKTGGWVSIAFDPRNITVRTDDEALPSKQMKYWTASSKRAKPLTEPLEILAPGILYLSINVDTEEPEELVLNIPELLVDGEIIPSQSVKFQRENRVKLRFLILNC